MNASTKNQSTKLQYFCIDEIFVNGCNGGAFRGYILKLDINECIFGGKQLIYMVSGCIDVSVLGFIVK